MDIWHRISFNASIKPDFFNTVKNYGIIKKTINLPGRGGIMVYIDIKETDPYWEDVNEFIRTYGASDIKDTFFTEKEIRSAKWLRLISTFEQGYPQPRAQWPIKQKSFEIICPNCAIYKQINPLRLTKEPSLGKKTFMSLIWTKEIFCKPEVFTEFSRIQATDFEVWDAIIDKTDEPSKIVKQLFIPNITPPGFVADQDLVRKKCPSCGITKYYPHLKGIMYFQKGASWPHVDFLLTHEWFGHGLLSWREILVSNRVANLILDKGWQGVRFKVVELV